MPLSQQEAEPRTVTGLLRLCAEKYADRPALRRLNCGVDEAMSFRELYESSLAVCRFIQERTEKGAHVALMGRTGFSYLVTLNAVMMAGCAAVPLAHGMSGDDAVHLLSDSDSEILVYDGGAVACAEELLGSLPSLRAAFDLCDEAGFESICEKYASAPGEPRETPDGVAAIIYTSGTTGERKGAMLTSSAIVSNIFFKEMNFEGGHVALNVLPMHHIFSFSCDYLKNLLDGVTVCLCADVSALRKELLYFEPTVIRLVPMIAESLLRRARIVRQKYPELTPRQAAERVFGRRLTNIIVSGAAYSADNDAEFAEMGIAIRQGYGMTETGPRIAVPDGKTCAASGGRIISICQVRLVNGEIQVKSPSLMSGYYKREAETAAAFTPDGWFRTGDIGRITPDGELFITGRLKNVIILSNGENVSPEEIERKLGASPAIAEVEIFEENGRIAADVYPEPSPDAEAEVRKAVAEYNSLAEASRAVDTVYIRTAPLQKTVTGKIKRRKFTS